MNIVYRAICEDKAKHTLMNKARACCKCDKAIFKTMGDEIKVKCSIHDIVWFTIDKKYYEGYIK